MDLIDEIARPGGPRDNVVTDFYFKVDCRNGASVHERYWVIETGRPTRTVGGVVVDRHFDYVVSVWRSTGWVEVVRMDQVHAEDSTVAASIAEAILSA